MTDTIISKYYTDYFEITGKSMATTGVMRWCDTEEQWETRLEILKMFQKDCDTILDIFNRYYELNQYTTPEYEKADFLRTEIVAAFPDFLVNEKQTGHVLWLMDNLMGIKGRRLLNYENRAYLNWGAIPQLECDVDINDIFRVWVADNVTELIAELKKKGAYSAEELL